MGDVDNKHKEIKELIKTFASGYPNVKLSEKGYNHYASTLVPFGVVATKRAIARAREASPDFMPTAERIRQFCHALKKASRGVTEEAKKQRPSVASHSLPPDHDFSKLADLYAEQSKKLQLDPNKPTPRPIAMGRFEVFKEVWVKHFGGEF